ncbi:MAG: MAE_28990/MAE_18760 family HEPN-like nuclease [Rhodomicrobium sp.]
MTKVRSREECLRAIQSDSAWRKKEIATLKGRIANSSDGDQAMLLRSAVVMLYAHWEGFVKTASTLYLSYINEVIRRRSVTLSKHFTDLIMWKMFREKGDHLFLKNAVPFLEMRAAWPCSPDELLPTDIINTESNLSSQVLRRLITTINLDYSPFQTKEKLIDEDLLKMRNQIAHGERVSVDLAQYETIDKQIRGLIDSFQQLLETCIQREQYCAVHTGESLALGANGPETATPGVTT